MTRPCMTRSPVHDSSPCMTHPQDHFVELTTQIGSMDIVVGGGKEERHLLLCEGAVTKEHVHVATSTSL